MVRALDKADAMRALYNIGSHLPFIIMLKSETSYHVTVLTALCHVNELSSSQKIERRAGTLNGDCHEMHHTRSHSGSCSSRHSSSACCAPLCGIAGSVTASLTAAASEQCRPLLLAARPARRHFHSLPMLCASESNNNDNEQFDSKPK